MGSECLEVEVPSFDDSSLQGRQRDMGGHRFSSALMVIRAGRCLRQLGLIGCQTGPGWPGTSSAHPGPGPAQTEGNQALAGGFVTTSATREAHQFSSVAQSCPTLCDPMDCSTPSPTPRACSPPCIIRKNPQGLHTARQGA